MYISISPAILPDGANNVGLSHHHLLGHRRHIPLLLVAGGNVSALWFEFLHHWRDFRDPPPAIHPAFMILPIQVTDSSGRRVGRWP